MSDIFRFKGVTECFRIFFFFKCFDPRAVFIPFTDKRAALFRSDSITHYFSYKNYSTQNNVFSELTMLARFLRVYKEFKTSLFEKLALDQAWASFSHFF